MIRRVLLTADPGIPVPPPGYGGIERILSGLARFLTRRGVEVGLLADASSAQAGVSLFPWSGKTVPLSSAVTQVGDAVRRFEPDLVHSFSRLAFLLPRLLLRRPTVMSYQRHTGGINIRVAAALGGDRLQFTGCSDFISTMGRKAGGTWETIHNFVDTEAIAFSGSVPGDAPLLFLSRIESIKGAHEALEIARLAGRRLILAGNHAAEGPEAHYWESQILPHLGDPGVEYVGEVGDREKFELLSGAAALILPLRWDEPFGIVFAESLATGTPVLTRTRGATPEIVKSGINGFLFDSIADAVAAVEQVPELNRAVCRRIAEERFDLAVAGRNYLSLYERLQGKPA